MYIYIYIHRFINLCFIYVILPGSLTEETPGSLASLKRKGLFSKYHVSGAGCQTVGVCHCLLVSVDI